MSVYFACRLCGFAEESTVFAKSSSPKASGSTVFDDVDPDSWYGEAVRWAAGEGIVLGYGNRKFGPGDPITREQMATMLYRYAQTKGGELTYASDLSAFRDGDTTADWSREAMLWAVENGLLSGKGGGILDPSGTASRAEVAQILMNYCGYIA